MRGLSGSGKSTLVNAISELYDMQDPVICSADHYFIDENGIYRFDPGRLRDAHEASQFLMKNSCEDGKKLIIVDNTHIQAWEMRPYFNNANRASFTYKVDIKYGFGIENFQFLPAGVARAGLGIAFDRNEPFKIP